VGVRDLAQAQRDFEGLGFVVRPGGHFPGGVVNKVIDSRDATYLELLSLSEPRGGVPPRGDAAAVAEFVKKHDGAMFLGLNVSSVDSAASYLRRRNFDVDGPIPGGRMKEGETKPPPPQWYLMSTAEKPAPDKLGINVPVFFIEYLASDRSSRKRAGGQAEHPNTALGIHAVWFAVRDLKAQLRALREAGFEVDESGDRRLLGADGREVRAGAGAMVLLASTDEGGALRQYLSNYDEGIVAISVEVADLSRAQRMAQDATGRTVRLYDGTYGRSFLLQPDVAHGVWLEMFQR
jgi:hypothetical protein